MPVIAKHRTINRHKRVPTRRFSGFTKNWDEVTFGKLFDFKPTNSFSREDLNYEKGEIRNIHYGDIHTKFQSNFDISSERVPFINQDKDISRIAEGNYCKEGDLVIADASEDYQDVGKAIEIRQLRGQKALAGLHTLLARSKEKQFAPGFLGYLMKTRTIRLQIMILAQGTKVFGISPRHLNEVIFKIPKLPEQQKIASFLTAVDNWIQNLRQQKEALQEYKKGMMQKVFSHEIQFKDEMGKEFPDWQNRQLDTLTSVPVSDGPHSTPKFLSDGIPFLSVDNLVNYRVSLTKLRYISATDHKEFSRKCKPQKGDLLMGKAASVGMVALVDFDIEFNIWSPIAVIRIKNEFDSRFFFYAFQSESVRRQVKRFTNTSSQGNIGMGDINKLILPVPESNEQKKIADFLFSLDQLITAKEHQITLAEDWKKGLMQGLFV